MSVSCIPLQVLTLLQTWLEYEDGRMVTTPQFWETLTVPCWLNQVTTSFGNGFLLQEVVLCFSYHIIVIECVSADTPCLIKNLGLIFSPWVSNMEKIVLITPIGNSDNGVTSVHWRCEVQPIPKSYAVCSVLRIPVDASHNKATVTCWLLKGSCDIDLVWFSTVCVRQSHLHPIGAKIPLVLQGSTRLLFYTTGLVLGNTNDMRNLGNEKNPVPSERLYCTQASKTVWFWVIHWRSVMWVFLSLCLPTWSRAPVPKSVS